MNQECSLFLPPSITRSSYYVDNVAHTFKLLEYCFTVGFMLGGFISGRQALLQFQAEHQHLLPLKRRSDYVMFVRNRNYRVMAKFGSGGMVRGSQMAAVGAVYETVRLGSEMIGFWPFAQDLLAGVATGGLFAYAGKGHRMYYLRKGVLFGGLMGLSLATIRIVHDKYQDLGNKQVED